MTLMDAFKRNPDADPEIYDEEILVNTPSPSGEKNRVTAQIQFTMTIGDTVFEYNEWIPLYLYKAKISRNNGEEDESSMPKWVYDKMMKEQEEQDE
jgi:hypothetical protein